MSEEVQVPLTIRRAYAAPELWYASGREVKLGCSRCHEFRQCGGLATEAPLFDCTSLCCGLPDSCMRYACPNQRRFSRLIREVGGLDLRPYKLPVTPCASLPSHIPFMADRGSLAGPLHIGAVAVGLYSIVDHRTGLSRFSSRDELLEHYRLSRDTKLVITATGQDRRVEHFWHVLQVKKTAKSLLKLRPAIITTPNFSMHVQTMRHDNLLSMARIAYCFEAFAAAGLPVAPHINGRTPFDFGRWIEFLNASPGVHTISYELGTVGRSKVRRAWHVEQLLRVARDVNRPLGLLVRAGSTHLADLARGYSRLYFVDSTPLMKAKHRQVATSVLNELHWSPKSTAAGGSIDVLFLQNVQVARRHYRALFAANGGIATATKQ